MGKIVELGPATAHTVSSLKHKPKVCLEDIAHMFNIVQIHYCVMHDKIRYLRMHLIAMEIGRAVSMAQRYEHLDMSPFHERFERALKIIRNEGVTKHEEKYIDE